MSGSLTSREGHELDELGMGKAIGGRESSICKGVDVGLLVRIIRGEAEDQERK